MRALLGSGLAAGFSLALALANLIRSQLFGLNPRDPLTFIGSAIVLALAAGVAGFLPALRASGVDPTTALRQEQTARDALCPCRASISVVAKSAKALTDADYSSKVALRKWS